ITSRPSLKTKTSKSSLVKNLYPNSSLVRRARLIRRSTTNQYCEHLKRLKEEDGVIIHQILIIRLKPREDASEYEKACIRGSNSAFVPSVEFAYPPVGNEACKFPPPLFYPDFTKSTVQRKEDLESFPVILTNEKGDRTYAYCFKFLSKPKSPDLSPDGSGSYSVLVFASHYSQEALFNQLAADFVATIQKDTTKLYTMCRDLLNLRLTTSEDAYKRSKYIVNKDLKWSKCAISTSIEKIGLENAVFIFLCLLAEKRVIVTGSNISDVSRTVQMFVRLLAPLEWPHTLIPIIPDSQSELCYNPTPYICGILRYNLSRVKDLICPLPGDTSDEITIIDVERGIVLPCLPLQILRDNELRVKALVNCGDAMGFPKSAISDLLSSL
ncbi:p70, partial [Aphelenchoides avenae]